MPHSGVKQMNNLIAIINRGDNERWELVISIYLYGRIEMSDKKQSHRMNFKEYKEKTSQNLREMIICARKLLGKKQYDLAQSIGISQGHYSKIENSNNKVENYDLELTYSQISYLFRYFNMPMDFINYGFIALGEAKKNPDTFKKFYKDDKASFVKISYLSPLLIHLSNNYFYEKKRILKQAGLDPIYISNLNSDLDINYVAKFLDFYHKSIDGPLDSLANYLIKYESEILKKILFKDNKINSIQRLIKGNSKIENIFDYTMLEDSSRGMELSYAIKGVDQLANKQKQNLYEYNNFILKLSYRILFPKRKYKFFNFIDLKYNFAKTKIEKSSNSD